jgi:hypothetical protein
MTAEQAMTAHKAWKERFRIAMATREQFDLATVAADNCCDFGQWLHGEGKALFGESAAYAPCVAHHEQFHLEAAKVAEQVNLGKMVLADQMLGQGTPYAKASEALSISLVALFGRHPENPAD